MFSRYGSSICSNTCLKSEKHKPQNDNDTSIVSGSTYICESTNTFGNFFSVWKNKCFQHEGFMLLLRDPQPHRCIQIMYVCPKSIGSK